MAVRALIGRKDYELEGEGLRVTFTVQFFGGQLSSPDSEPCTALLTAAMTKAQARAAIRAQIDAAATRLGYGSVTAVVLFEELFVGL